MEDFYFDLSGLFDGSASDPIITKAKNFRKELELINKKYGDFFTATTSANAEPDSLFNHCKTYIGYDPVKFFFTDNVVPEHIQKECFDVFNRIFEY